MNNDTILRCDNVYKSYAQGPQKIEVLKGIELTIGSGEHIGIIGASGSGKSTLLNILGGLDKPDSGEVFVDGKAFSSCNENERGRVRNASLGFVYQFHHLLPEFTAIENVAMPLLIGRIKKREARDRAATLLEQVGLGERLQHKPSQLSGGERQRVAIARALANNPGCVLMDEPTGNLDAKNANAIQQLMKQLSNDMATSFVVVTHDEKLARTLDTVYELEGGLLHVRKAS